MSCDNVITVQDLETDKKHSTFYREVITGKAGGTGADIDSATNAVTGQTQSTLPKVLSNVGFSPAGFDFTTGGTLTERDKSIFYQTDGNWYSWGGTLPKVVPPASSPASTGGIADNAWNVSTSAFMYRDWEGFTAELLAQGGVPDNGQPDELGNSKRVDAIERLIKKNGTFDSVLTMASSSWLKSGDVVKTLSYHNDFNLGGAIYRITSDTTDQNTSTKIPVNNCTLSAELVWDGVNFNAGWSGAKLDTISDDWDSLHNVLKVIGSFKITSYKNIEKTINLILPSSFKLSKTLWCGYVNINIIMQGKCMIDNSVFVGDTVIDFDYSLLRAPVDVLPLITRDSASIDGGWHGWNARHKLDFENTNPTYNWTNNINAHQVNFVFTSNPSVGDTVYLNGYKIIFGTDVTIGASATSTRDNLVTYIGSNFKFQALAVGANAEIYSANPWLCRSDTSAITIVKWQQGLSAARVSNMWNGRIEFISCSNFDVQLWENPCNKDLGGGNYSEFGMENNEYDFGKMQNCQIMHLATPVVRSFVSMGLMPYCIDTKLLSGSARISNLTGANTKPHYVNLIACKYLRLRTTDALEAETTGATTGEHCLCMVLGDNENYDYDIRYMAERYKNNARIYDIGKTGTGPIDIYVRTSFTDSDGVPTFIDNSKTRMNFSDISYAGNGVSVGIDDKFTVPVFVAGKIGKLRDLSITANVTLKDMMWYKREDNTENASATIGYWDAASSNVKCDGYNGPGVTVVNDGSSHCRFRVDHQGGTNTKLVIRFIDSGGNPVSNNTVSARGASYDSSYRAFLSTTAGKSIVRCSMGTGIKAQIFLANANDLSNSSIAKSLKIMQYHNEEMIYKN